MDPFPRGISHPDRVVRLNPVQVSVAGRKAHRVVFGPPAERRVHIAMPEAVEADPIVSPALEEVLPGMRIRGKGIPARIVDRDAAVGVIDVTLHHRAGGVDDGGDVPVGVLLDPVAFAGAVAQDQGVDVDRAPDVLGGPASRDALFEDLPGIR